MAALLLALLLADKPADQNVTPDAAAEIARRGAMVERVAGVTGPEDPQQAFASAVAPPPDDSHKWFFSLVVTRGCRWCEQMRADFERDQRLRAWVNVKDPKQSWAHWQVFQIEDQSQQWRWKDYRPRQFPTLIVQPPLNGAWGDPKTVVFLCEGYLAPDVLDARMRAAIQAYARKVWPQHVAWRKSHAQQKALAGPIGQDTGQYERDRQPPAPAPSPLPEPSVPFVLPPAPAPQPQAPGTPEGVPLALLVRALLSLWPSAQTLLLILLTASNLWMLYRDLARQTGVRLLIDDQTAAQIRRVIQTLTGPSPGPGGDSGRPPGS